VGVALDALSASGGHHELGFSSLEAYARERCARSGRWAADTRALAKRLRGLPRTREALQLGVIGWSTAELLARHMTGDSEVEWLGRAGQATVRELRSLLADAGAKVGDDAADEREATRALTVRATREDGWRFECARKVADAIAGPMSPDRLIQALLAEGYSTLLELVPESVQSELHDIERLEHESAVESEAHVAWRTELRSFRSDAEELCEGRLSSLHEMEPPAVTETTVSSYSLPRAPEALDREIRRLCSELSAHDLAIGIVAESAWKAEVWRRLGFATEAQYARERVGVSLSSLKAKRILAARAARSEWRLRVVVSVTKPRTCYLAS
jgi:hypothetical protein